MKGTRIAKTTDGKSQPTVAGTLRNKVLDQYEAATKRRPTTLGPAVEALIVVLAEELEGKANRRGRKPAS